MSVSIVEICEIKNKILFVWEIRKLKRKEKKLKQKNEKAVCKEKSNFIDEKKKVKQREGKIIAYEEKDNCIVKRREQKNFF